jgi:DNA-binding response OmpR family regulator
MRKKGAHQIPDFGPAPTCQRHCFQPRFDIDRFHLGKTVRPPAWKNPLFQVNVVGIGVKKSDFVITALPYRKAKQAHEVVHADESNCTNPSVTRLADPTSSTPALGRVLVVEDDPSVQKVLKHLFEAEGYAVEVHGDGQSALESFHAFPPAIIVLDLRLPKLSGRDLCKEVKAKSPTLPIVVLSAASDVSDKVLLLELGADDYVTKPFSPRELLARVRAALRHTSRTSNISLVRFDNISVDLKKMEVLRDGEVVVLTAQEFKTLRFFVQNPDRVISRDELLKEVWGYQNLPSTRTVDNHILRLRQKLERDMAEPVHFRTVHGVGYKFVR